MSKYPHRPLADLVAKISVDPDAWDAFVKAMESSQPQFTEEMARRIAKARENQVADIMGVMGVPASILFGADPGKGDDQSTTAATATSGVYGGHPGRGNQESTDRCLFLGGPLDGERLDVPGHTSYWETSVMDNEEMEKAAMDPNKIVFTRYCYKRKCIRGKARLFWVFVLDGMSIDEVIESLLEAY